MIWEDRALVRISAVFAQYLEIVVGGAAERLQSLIRWFVVTGSGPGAVHSRCLGNWGVEKVELASRRFS